MKNRSAGTPCTRHCGSFFPQGATGWLFLVLGLGLLFGCGGPRVSVPGVGVQIRVDGRTKSASVPAGSSVSEALQAAGILLGSLDMVDPPAYTVVSKPAVIRVIRVTERDEVQESPLPYPQQIVRSPALAPGETRLVQAGVEGQQETTYRIVYHDGLEVSRSAVSSTVVQPATPEILMEGSEPSVATVPVPGTLAYLDGGNAWILKGDSSSPVELETGGNLDGRVFSLSPAGDWLAYTVRNPAGINSLEIIQTSVSAKPVDLGVANVVQFAAFSPADPSLLAYSTAVPSPSAPGWKANNDLGLLHLSSAGQVLQRQMLLQPQVGGAYGWWGTRFAWAPDGLHLAYARADSIGIVDATSGAMTQLAAVTPYQTLADWAWVPPLAWMPDGSLLLSVLHGPPIGLEIPEASPAFDLVALSVKAGYSVTLQGQAGMFSDPVVVGGGTASVPQIVFLQAILPLESATSTYALEVMSRDGSNLRRLFPPEGEQGLGPQEAAGSPDGKDAALVYQGDLWLVDLGSGQAQPLTADQLVTAADWR